VPCPGCGKTLAADGLIGQKVRCPGCSTIFVVPTPTPEPTRQQESRPPAREPEPPARPAQRPRHEPEKNDFDFSRPQHSSRRRSYDDAEDDLDFDDRRPVSAPSGPMILAILSCVLACIPLIGGPVAWVALRQATTARDALPPGIQAHSARRHLESARFIASIAIVLNAIAMFLGLCLNILSRRH